MSNDPKNPSKTTDVNAEADQLTPEDLEKIAAGQRLQAWNIGDIHGNKTVSRGGSVGSATIAGATAKKTPGS